MTTQPVESKREITPVANARPFGIHCIQDIYHPDVQAGLPDGRYVAAVAEPYTANRLQAAWWVFTGRAFAMLWPKDGDLEGIFQRRAYVVPGRPPQPFVADPARNAQNAAYGDLAGVSARGAHFPRDPA